MEFGGPMKTSKYCGKLISKRRNGLEREPYSQPVDCYELMTAVTVRIKLENIRAFYFYTIAN